MRINILDSSIYNKIAAGEVVEKPASVVKELVENSIDAKSTNIVIEIVNGGIDLIKITDNGIGMDKEDLKRAFLPHATSKISSVEDLSKIGTLGFRGEALASISAVSDVEILSRTEEGEGGKITCKDTIISEPIECGSAKGTTIIVSDLFKNIPARKKFLRKPKSEENDVTSYVEKIILANPTIAIQYICNGKIIYNSTGKNLKEAIYVIYGKQVLDNLTEVSLGFKENLKVEGFCSKPTFSKSNRNYQTLICNGRYIQNQQISLAISNAYGGYMMKGQFPFYVLSLTIPVDEVDVNFHPNKLEVRFLNKQQIYSLFYNTVEQAILNNRTKVNSNDFVPKDIKDKVTDIDITSQFTNEYLKNHSVESIERLIKENGQNSLKYDDENVQQNHKNYELISNTKNKENINEEQLKNNDEKNIDCDEKQEENNLINNETTKRGKKPKKDYLNMPYNELFKNDDKPKYTEYDLTTDKGLEKQFKSMVEKSKRLEDISNQMDTARVFRDFEKRCAEQDNFNDENYSNLPHTKKININQDMTEKIFTQMLKESLKNGNTENEDDDEFLKNRTISFKDSANYNSGMQNLKNENINIISQNIGDNAFEKNNKIDNTKEENNFIQEQIDIEPETIIIGSCFDTYLLVQKGDLFIIDQHAGHERLLYDELTKAIDSKKVLSQQLLLPYVFSVDSTEIDYMERNIPLLNEIGFDIERVGEKEFSISCVPMILDGINLKEFIDNFLSEMPVITKLKNSDLVRDKLKTMSCRKAIKAGYKMTKGDIELLLKLFNERNTTLMCPHGRPSVIRLTKYDFEKWFKRAV